MPGVEGAVTSGGDGALSAGVMARNNSTNSLSMGVYAVHAGNGYGVYAHSLPLAGLTVRQARLELEDRMNIHPEAVAVVDGVQADEAEVLCEGQVLNFLTPAGEKG